ncbi:MAG: glycoside hydrolase family 3 protein [Acidimicrobiaceae bacterium]|nr:glycoside hydrolase family 3 protein [Acidimicrobiaceae bacterium]
MSRSRVLVTSAVASIAALSLGLALTWTDFVAGATSAQVTNLSCARTIVSTWSLTRVARETVVVSVQASDLARVTGAASQGYGGFLLFGATAPTSLPTTIRSFAHLEPDARAPMVMSDDEGGGIIRFANLVGRWPWAQVMGSTMTPVQITQVGHHVGAALAAVGVNVDLAPVADVDGRPQWPSAANPDGLRSFGGSPTRDGVDVVAFANGLRSAHVLAVVKHFPGLGHATGNTDYAPAATQPWPTLQSTGLVPFRRAIASGVDAVMMSNASVPGLTTLPAGLSAVAVAQLRNQLGFHGLIMSDALGAGAITARHLSIAQASVDALAAGVDQVLAVNPHSFQQSLQTASLTTAAIVAAVAHGTLTRTLLVVAAAQVLAATNTLSCPS